MKTSFVFLAVMLCACGQGERPAVLSSLSTSNYNNMTVAVHGTPGGDRVAIHSVYLGPSASIAAYVLYNCGNGDCMIDMTKDQVLSSNQPIDALATGRVFVNDREVLPSMPNSWYARAGTYKLPTDMGYNHSIYLGFDGSAWIYDADVSH